MTEFFNFYPASGAETVTDIPVADVTGKADEFGCVETTEGLYVPTTKTDWSPFLGPSDVLIDILE